MNNPGLINYYLGFGPQPWQNLISWMSAGDEVSRWEGMEGADGDDLLEWEALYLRLPGSRNLSWNATEWTPGGWNVSEGNGSWWDPSAPFDSPAALVRAAVKAVVLGLLILATVVGAYVHIYTTLHYTTELLARYCLHFAHWLNWMIPLENFRLCGKARIGFCQKPNRSYKLWYIYDFGEISSNQ